MSLSPHQPLRPADKRLEWLNARKTALDAERETSLWQALAIDLGLLIDQVQFRGAFGSASTPSSRRPT